MRALACKSTEVIEGAQFTTINLLAGASGDDVDLDALLTGKTVTLNLEGGDDNLDVALESDDLDNAILSNVTIDGGPGTDTAIFHDRADAGGNNVWTITSSVVNKGGRQMTYSLAEVLDIRGSDDVSTTYNIDATPAATSLQILGGALGDIFNAGNGDFDTNLGGAILLNAAGGGDVLNVDDTLDDASGDVYDFDAGQFSKPGQAIDYTQIEAISLLGSNQNSTYRINSTEATLTIAAGDGTDTVRVGNAAGSVTTGQEDINAIVSVNGGGGDDTFFVGSGDLDEISATVILNGGASTDSLFVNDVNDGGGDQYHLVDGLLTKTAGGGVFVALNYSLISDATIDLNDSANVFNFTNGFGSAVVEGNGGADTFNIISTSATPTIRGGTALDELIVNEDQVGTAAVILDQDEDLAALELYEGSTLTVAQVAGDAGIVTGSFGFARGALNLNDNFIVVQDASISFLVDKLMRGYNGGVWNGVPAGGSSGVIRSATAAGSPLADALGYAEVGAGSAQLNIANYRGASVAAGDVVISYTLYGDSDLNRTVNLLDFNRLAAGFNSVGTGWTEGNSNYDNTTNLIDFNLLAANFNTGLAPVAASSLNRGASGRASLVELLEQAMRHRE